MDLSQHSDSAATMVEGVAGEGVTAETGASFAVSPFLCLLSPEWRSAITPQRVERCGPACAGWQLLSRSFC